MQVRLYDGWNYFRLVAETDPTSLGPRGLYQAMVAAPGALHIWVWDGRGARAARQEIFPDYKTKRKPKPQDIAASIELWRELLIHTPAYSIEVPGYEADDVMAVLVDHYTSMRANVEIYSNDFDLMALTRPGVVCGARPKEGVKPEDIQTYKTFVGDPSDCIPGVKGFGQKAWEAADKKVLRSIALACEAGKPIDHLLKPMFVDKVRDEASIKGWILQNQDLIGRMWKIIGFLPVPMTLITDNLKRPIPNPAAVELKLREYLL